MSHQTHYRSDEVNGQGAEGCLSHSELRHCSSIHLSILHRMVKWVF